MEDLVLARQFHGTKRWHARGVRREIFATPLLEPHVELELP